MTAAAIVNMTVIAVESLAGDQDGNLGRMRVFLSVSGKVNRTVDTVVPIGLATAARVRVGPGRQRRTGFSTPRKV